MDAPLARERTNAREKLASFRALSGAAAWKASTQRRSAMSSPLSIYRDGNTAAGNRTPHATSGYGASA
jgi:hypothetical protein